MHDHFGCKDYKSRSSIIISCLSNFALLLALLMELETTRKRLYEFLLVDSVNWRYLVKSVEFPEKKHFHDIFSDSSVRESLIPFAISYENDVIQEACLTCGTIGVYSGL